MIQIGEKEAAFSQIPNSSNLFESSLLPSVFDLYPQVHHQVHLPCSEMAGTEGKGKRVFCTRATMDFDPTPKILHSQKEVDEYLERYDVQLPSNVKVEWWPADTDYIASPKVGGVNLRVDDLSPIKQ